MHFEILAFCAKPNLTFSCQSVVGAYKGGAGWSCTFWMPSVLKSTWQLCKHMIKVSSWHQYCNHVNTEACTPIDSYKCKYDPNPPKWPVQLRKAPFLFVISTITMLFICTSYTVNFISFKQIYFINICSPMFSYSRYFLLFGPFNSVAGKSRVLANLMPKCKFCSI